MSPTPARYRGRSARWLESFRQMLIALKVDNVVACRHQRAPQALVDRLLEDNRDEVFRIGQAEPAFAPAVFVLDLGAYSAEKFRAFHCFFLLDPGNVRVVEPAECDVRVIEAQRHSFQLAPRNAEPVIASFLVPVEAE